MATDHSLGIATLNLKKMPYLSSKNMMNPEIKATFQLELKSALFQAWNSIKNFDCKVSSGNWQKGRPEE